MARPRNIDEQLIELARQVVRKTEDFREYREAMSVLLPHELNATLEQTARVLGVGRVTVLRLQASCRRRSGTSDGVRKSWGGRRHELMSEEEEKAFLLPWAEQAQTGVIVVSSPIRAALAQRLGREKVAASVVRRLLKRHGWRKVAPDTRHPKSDPQSQEDYKKNSRKIWLPC